MAIITNYRVYFVANRTDVGTFPPGSQWAKNPIPGDFKNQIP